MSGYKELPSFDGVLDLLIVSFCSHPTGRASTGQNCIQCWTSIEEAFNLLWLQGYVINDQVLSYHYDLRSLTELLTNIVDSQVFFD